ncbi:MAG TPA: mechanosensitive ion channel [Acidobacteriota bacterium]|nr:mechanosensitive ion channel [Acidobacteriota bacterium]
MGLLIAVALTCVAGGQAFAQSTATPAPVQAGDGQSRASSPVDSPDTPTIPSPRIADEAMQLDQRLRTLPDRLAPESLLAEISEEVNQLRAATSERSSEMEVTVPSNLFLAELQQSLLEWQSLSNQVTDLAENLTGWATSLEAEARSMGESESLWTRTYDRLRAEKSPAKLRQLARKAIADIRAAANLVEEQRTQIAALQQSVAEQSSIVSAQVQNLRKAMAQSQRSLFEPDSPPLWKSQFREQTEVDLARSLRDSLARDLTRLTHFFHAKKGTLFGIVLLTIGSFVLFVRLGRSSAALDARAPGVFSRPASLALLVGVVAAMPLLADAPAAATGLAFLLTVVPVVRLLMPRLTPQSRMLPVVLLVAVVVWQLIRFLEIPVWIKRDVMAVFCLVVVATFWRVARGVRQSKEGPRRAPAATLAAIRVGLALIIAALVANIFGYFRLSDLLTNGTLVSAYRAVALYTVFIVGKSIVTHVLQAEMPRRLALLGAGTGRVARQLSFILGLLVFVGWLHSVLAVFTVRERVYGAILAALRYEITIGSVGFALSSILAFFLTLLIGYLVATLIRTILGDAILPRLKLERGLPNAIATITHYVVLVLIFILALAAAGVELSRFTLLTGAIGVGLGFGLQNIVNNFVSGLILLFERPVRVGDFLEIGGIGGEVTKIGFRSSMLHCFDGSDLIIPNADLISQQVVNWTLTGTRRQIVLNIQVTHGNDATRVRDLLRDTVAAHPEVLELPKPTALFLGFGDSALNFEVRFWAPRPEIVPELKSDVALGIAATLDQAGIKAPIPQRDLYIRSTDQQASAEGSVASDLREGVVGYLSPRGKGSKAGGVESATEDNLGRKRERHDGDDDR